MKNFNVSRLLPLFFAFLPLAVFAQTNKVLFDASSAQMAGNADWVIDADLFNIGFPAPGLPVVGAGNESNPARFPSPAQSNVTSTTSEQFWKGGLSSFAISLAKLNYTVETLPYNGQITFNNSSNAQDLSNYKVFVVCEPNLPFSAAEKTAIVQWVQAGGGLLMIANHNGSDRNNDGQDAPAIWNNLMSSNGVAVNPFGITFDLANFSQTTTNKANLPTNKILNGSQGSVGSMIYSAGTSMTIDPTKNATVKGLFWKSGATKNNNNIMLAQANYGAGRVVAIGDSSPADDGTGDTNDQLYNGFTGQASGNHKKMFLNSVIWLAGNAGPMPPPNVDNALKTNDLVHIFPNPASEFARVSFPEVSGSASVRVFDFSGVEVFKNEVDKGEFQMEIPLVGLPKGVYLVEFVSGEGRSFVRFVVN